MRSQASGGGRGLGAGAHPGGEEASATREKTRSVGSECVSERGDYVFDRAMKNPTPATNLYGSISILLIDLYFLFFTLKLVFYSKN